MLSPRAILFAAALYATSSLAADCSRSYTVAPGDTCDAISAAQKASTYQLAVLNPTINDGCLNLEVGQTLCLGTAGSDCTAIHTVVPGDVCDSVIAQYGINSTMLWANNPQLDVDCSNLYIGESVCVDAKYNVPSLAKGQAPVSKKVPAGVEAAKKPTPAPAPAVASSTIAHSSAPAYSAPAYSAPAYSAPAYSAPAYSAPASKPSSAAPAATTSAAADDDDDLPWCEGDDDGW